MTDSLQSKEPVIEEQTALIKYVDQVGLMEIEVKPESRVDKVNPYIDLQVDLLNKRPITIATGAWSSASIYGSKVTTLDLHSAFWNNVYVSNVLKGFRYWRYKKFFVKVMINSTMTHYGKLLLTWLPVTSATTYTNQSMVALSCLPSVVLDATERASTIIEIPYIQPNHYLDPLPSGDLGPRISLDVLAPLGNAQIATAVTVPYTIQMWAEGIEVMGPQIPQMEMPVGSIPPTDYLDNWEKEVGSERKKVDPIPLYVTQKSMTPLLSSRNQDNSIRFSMANDTEADHSKAMVQSVMKDEHNVKNILRLPSLLETVTFDDTSASGSIITYFPAHPANAASTTSVAPFVYPLSHLAAMSRQAIYWKGGIKYMFSFTCAKTVTARVAIDISFASTVTEATNSGNLFTTVFDINGSCDKCIEVPYTSNRPYLPTYNAMKPDALTAVTPRYWPMVRLSIVNPVTVGTSNTSATIYCNIYVAGADDFSLYIPVGHGTTGVTTSYEWNQMDLRSAFREKFELIGPGSNSQNLVDYNFGEEFENIFDLASRYANPFTVAASGLVLARIVYGFLNLYRLRRFGCRYKVFNNASNAITASLGWVTFAKPLWDFNMYDVITSDSLAGQWELPYYNSLFFESPGAPTDLLNQSGGLFVNSNISGLNTTVYTAYSEDSVFSFPTGGLVVTYAT